MKKILKLLPVFDQSMSALFNFMLIFLTSMFLIASDFVMLNNIYLYIMLLINIMNAIIYQPLMLNYSQTKKIYNGYIIQLFMVHISLIVLMFLVFRMLYKIDYTTLIISAVLASLMVLYELFRRLAMLQNNWLIVTCTGLAINLLSWSTLIIVNEITIIKVLIVISSSYFVMCVVLFLYLFSKQVSFSSQYNKMRNQGWFLLGGAVSFWFISGGYLLVLTDFISDDNIVFLRVIQNLLSGILIILTAFDNFVLSGKRVSLDNSRYKLYITLFIFIYGLIVYGVINVFYNFEHILFALIVWLIFYYVLSLSKMKMTVLKSKGHSSIVFISQFVGSLIFILSLYIWHFFMANVSSIYVSINWLLCGCIILLLVKIYSNAIKGKIK